MGPYVRPASLDEALARRAEGGWTVLAGGTDFYPARVGRAVTEPVLDLTGLAELRGISRSGDGYRIGALTTWTDVVRADLPPAFEALKQAAREVGSVQVQNSATVAGNLCNASPAADGVPPLLILDAEVELMSAEGARRLPLGDFLQGNRRTALAPGELMTAIRIPERAARGRSAFLKLGARKYLVISIVMAAARLDIDGRAVRDAAVSVGACSAVALRLPALEADLTARPAGTVEVADAHLAPIAPIDDIRGDAGYRREAARELVARTVSALAS